MMFGLFDLWFRMTIPGYASEVTREDLGNLRAGPYADPFRPPPFDPMIDVQHGGTGVPPVTRPERQT